MKRTDHYVKEDWMDSIKPFFMLLILLFFLTNGIISTYSSDELIITIELAEGMEGETGSDSNDGKDKGGKDHYTTHIINIHNNTYLNNTALINKINMYWGSLVLEIPLPPPEYSA